jgi:hypothetical protein
MRHLTFHNLPLGQALAKTQESRKSDGRVRNEKLDAAKVLRLDKLQQRLSGLLLLTEIQAKCGDRQRGIVFS